MTEHDELTEQDPDRRPREELDDGSMGHPGEQGFSLTGMTEDAAAVTPPEAAGGNESDSDGTPVGRADVDADARRSGAD